MRAGYRGGMDAADVPPPPSAELHPELDDPAELAALEGVRALIRYLGYDPDAASLVDTPSRVVGALLEMTSGQWMDPAPVLERVFASDTDEMIAVTGIEFTSVCEHHLMPFSGTAAVAYIPKPRAPVVGLSKIPRLVHLYARRLSMQERMTTEITTALNTHLHTEGAACVIRSRHACMGARGIRAQHAEMVTSSMTGLFRDDPRTREEFLALATK